MRVTGSMLSSSLLRNLNSNLKDLSKYENQISSNRRIIRLSDDPIGAVSSMQIENDLSHSTQYSRNVKDAQAWLTETESILSEMNGVVVRAKELAGQACNGTYSAEQRDTIAQEVKELQDYFVDLANTKFAGKYIFGGYNTTSQPFSASGGAISYNSIDLLTASAAEIDDQNAQVKQYKLSPSTTFDVSIAGSKVMRLDTGGDNIFNMFEGFLDKLESEDVTPELAEYAAKFTDAQQHILSLTTDVGGRQARLDLVSQRYENENINLNDLYKKTAGIDQASVITQYKMAETTYNAALQVGAQIIQLSLVNFLR